MVRKQRRVEAYLDDDSAGFSYDSSSDLGTGKSGLYADKTDVTPVLV